jgi:hypothetical protein
MPIHALALCLARLPALITLLWVHPPWFWPLPAAAIIGAEIISNGAALSFSFNQRSPRCWWLAELGYVLAWTLFSLIDASGLQPNGGLLLALCSLGCISLSPYFRKA